MAWYLPGTRRPAGYSTVAESNLICVLAADGLTWAQMFETIIYSPDAKAIAGLFVAAGFGDTLVSEHVIPQPG